MPKNNKSGIPTNFCRKIFEVLAVSREIKDSKGEIKTIDNEVAIQKPKKIFFSLLQKKLQKLPKIAKRKDVKPKLFHTKSPMNKIKIEVIIDVPLILVSP